MNLPEPLVSVLLPIYNEPLSWIRLAIESVLEQTFRDFEIIAVLDHPERVDVRQLFSENYSREQRISFFENPANVGLAQTLDNGAQHARGKYIARMDADDQSLPDRLARQIEFLESNPEIVLCGTQVVKVDESGRKLGQSNSPLNFELIRRMAPYVNVATHPTIMMRREVFEAIGGYRILPGGEDYDLILRLLDAGYKMVNLPEALLVYRVRTNSETNGRSGIQKLCFFYVQSLHWQRKRTGRDEFDENHIHTILEQRLARFGQQQDKAQHLLIAAKRRLVQGQKVQAAWLLFRSFLTSPIQRRYYLDWMRAEWVKRLYALQQFVNNRQTGRQ